MEHIRIKVNASQATTIYKYKNLKTKLIELDGLIIKLFVLKMTRNESKHVTM
jgi:ferritin-like protein